MPHRCQWTIGQALREDLAEYRLTYIEAVGSILLLHTFGINILYRASHALANRGHTHLAQVPKALILALWSADISPRSCLGEGFTIAHSPGIVIGGGVKTGKRCKVFSAVVLGGRGRTGEDGQAMPRIGDNVMICSSAAVLGPIDIGNGAVIGAHALVMAHVPSYQTVTGTWSARQE